MAGLAECVGEATMNNWKVFYIGLLTGAAIFDMLLLMAWRADVRRDGIGGDDE
jgi:hypothetical protein